MNKAEQPYSASESEMLALLWANKLFSCYLYGKQFLVKTNNSALSYLRKFAGNKNRTMRWSYKLSEVDFVIEQKAGSKIGHVDALSRHVGAVIDGGSLDK